MQAQALIPTSNFHKSVDLVEANNGRAYPATTKHMPFLDPQFLAETLNVRHKVPSGVVFNRSSPALPINTSGPDPTGA